MADHLPQRWWRIVHSETSLGWGGQEHRVLAELTGFQQRGCQVWLLAPKNAELTARATAAAIPSESISSAKWRYPFEALRVARWLRRIQPDVLNTHSSRDGWLVGAAGRLARVPLVIRSRHFDVPLADRWISRHAYVTLCDHVITTSPKVATEFRKIFHLPDNRITTIPTGIDPKEFSPEGPKAKLRLSTIDGPLLGIIGVIRKAKGHITLLEAVRRMSDAGYQTRCIIVGDGPNRSAVEAKVHELKLTDRVHFTGQRNDVPAILRALDLLVIPSLHEAIPQVGLQALATMTPVVGSNVGGIPEIIRPGETGRIFPAEDAAALAGTIRAALSETEATRAMSERGRTMVEAKHSLEAMLDTIDALYRRYLPS